MRASPAQSGFEESTDRHVRVRATMANAEHCRREGIAQSLYHSWSKEFLEAGKRRLAGDTARQSTSPEVKDLRRGGSAEG
jgi:transposase